MGFFKSACGLGPTLPKNLSHIFYNEVTWHSYTLHKENPKIYKSRDTPLEFCCYQHFPPKISNFSHIKKYKYRLHFNA